LETPIVPINEKELHDQILHSLKRRAPVDQIIFDLCQKTGWKWKKASDFVIAVLKEHQSEISFLWLKAFSIMGIACLAIGLLLLFYILEVSIGWNTLFSCIQRSIEPSGNSSVRSASELECLGVTLMGIMNIFSEPFGYIGITLVIGGLTGFILAQSQMKNQLRGIIIGNNG
jgi:hypothetical protein